MFINIFCLYLFSYHYPLLPLVTGRDVLVLCGPRYSRHSVDELGAEQHVGVIEHAVLQGNNDELGLFEMRLQHVSDVLRMTEIKGGIHFVQNVERGRLE